MTGSGDSVRDVPAVLQGLPMAFYALDEAWRFAYVNPCAEELIGQRAEDVLGGVVWDLYPAAVGTVIEETYRQTMVTRQPATFDAYYPAPLNAWFEIHCHPSSDGLYVYFLDISDRRAASAADERAAARADLMARLASALTLTMDAEETAAAIPRLLVPDLGDWCIISLVDDRASGPWRERVRDIASWHADPDLRSMTDRYMHTRIAGMSEQSPLSRALTTSQPVVIQSDALNRGVPFLQSSEAFELVTALAPESVAIFPLLGHGRTVGVLTIVNAAERGPFTKRNLTILREVSQQVGLTLDNARLYGAHRDLSEELQRGLITELPQLSDVRLAARYWPAAHGVHIGGDWYDAFRCRDQLCLVIGDVTGHDRDAAVAMSQVRNLLRGVAYGQRDSPSAVLATLDDAIAGLEVETLTTAIMATVTPTGDDGRRRTQELRWSNAGHLPPLAILPDGTGEFLDAAADVILGLDVHEIRHDHTIALPPGAKVLLYTDGLIERRGEHLDIGLERLQHAASRLGALDVDELCDALMDDLGGGTDDDVALLALSVDGNSS